MIGEATTARYLIEAKERFDSDAVEELLSVMTTGSVEELPPKPVAYNNSVSSAIRDAVDQLENSVTDAESDFRLVWLQGDATDREIYFRTLCGGVYLFCPDRPTLLRGYFFTESEFFTNRARLDGAFIGDRNGWDLTVNPFSPRSESLLASPLARQLRDRNALKVLPEEEDGQDTLYVDCGIHRARSDEVLAYVCEKYQLRLNVMPLLEIGAVYRYK